MYSVREFRVEDLDILERIYFEERLKRFFFLDQSAFGLDDFKRDVKGKKVYVLIDDGLKGNNIIGFGAVDEENGVLTDFFVLNRYRTTDAGREFLKFFEAEYPNLVVRNRVRDIFMLNFLSKYDYKNLSESCDYFKVDYMYLQKVRG